MKNKKRTCGKVILLAASAFVLATAVTLLTAKLPMFFTDREADTVGRIIYCGWPIPWVKYAPGYSIMHAFKGLWIIPINWAWWLLLTVWFCGFRTLCSFIGAYFLTLVIGVGLVVGTAIIANLLTIKDIVALLTPQ